jgi:hypothetical protein
MLLFQDGTEFPHTKTITYDHIHTMEKAIRTTSQRGFMLRNMDHEVCSRFVDELLLHDKNAKAIGDVNISLRDEFSACIGEGNKIFFQILDSWSYLYTDKSYFWKKSKKQ